MKQNIKTLRRLSAFTFGLMLLFTACNNAPEPDTTFHFDGTCWFDGYEYFVGHSDTVTNKPDLYIFRGGTLHEGGAAFALLQVSADTFIIQPFPLEEWTAVGVEGDTAVMEHQGNQTIIVCHRPNDPESDTLWLYDPGNLSPMAAYEQLLLQRKLKALAGTYFDPQKKLTYQFVDTLLVRTDDKGVADTASFHFFYSFEMPSQILQFSNGDQFWYELTPKGMDLYDIKYWKQEEDFSRESLIAQLEKQR